MKSEDFRIAREGPPLDRLTDEDCPVVGVALYGDIGRNSGRELLPGFRSHFISV